MEKDAWESGGLTGAPRALISGVVKWPRALIDDAGAQRALMGGTNAPRAIIGGTAAPRAVNALLGVIGVSEPSCDKPPHGEPRSELSRGEPTRVLVVNDEPPRGEPPRGEPPRGELPRGDPPRVAPPLRRSEWVLIAVGVGAQRALMGVTGRGP